MDTEIQHLASDLELNLGVEKDKIEEVQRALELLLPHEYVDWMLFSNGGEGSIGESYLALWSIEEIILLNEDYEVNKFASGLLLFGSDGGDTTYAFDTRAETFPVVEVPFIGMSLEGALEGAPSFFAFLRGL